VNICGVQVKLLCNNEYHQPSYVICLNYFNAFSEMSFSCDDKQTIMASNHTFIHSFIHQWIYSPLLGPDLFFSSVIFFTQTVGFPGRVISPSQGRYLHRGQHKHRINVHTDIHDLSRIRTHDPSFRASEYNSCLRPRGHCDRRRATTGLHIHSGFQA
jgi:hypothetical protein